jgi:urease accessory protein
VARTAWTYQSISGYCTSALKLIRIGQEGTQRILHDTVAFCQTSIAKEETNPRLGWFNPLLEISSMRHAISPERLFLS